jgi:hypothetical protein
MNRIIPAVALLALAACSPAAPVANEADLVNAAAAAETDQDRFFANLATLCGQSFEGRIASPPADADADFAGKRLVMQVRDCSDDVIRIPFHVGDDHSRTWVITRTAEGLRLKHDHRHEDGSEDVLTQYGGDTTSPGTATRQEFPADQFSKDLFTREDRAVSNTNVWAVEVDPGRLFGYELRRPNRFFRVDFDLTNPVEAPPAPWGADIPATTTG